MKNYLLLFLLFSFTQCKKENTVISTPVGSFYINEVKVNETLPVSGNFYHTSLNPSIRISFSAPINQATAGTNISLTNQGGSIIPISLSYANDSQLVVQPLAALSPISKYTISVLTALKAQNNDTLQVAGNYKMATQCPAWQESEILREIL